MKVLVINGPNLKYLGNREPDIYGNKTLTQINEELRKVAENNKMDIDFYVSDIEGEIVSRIQKRDYDALIINPGAYSHYSLAIYDALLSIDAIKIEVHISNVFKREKERHNLLTAGAVDAVIAGFANKGYELALKSLV